MNWTHTRQFAGILPARPAARREPRRTWAWLLVAGVVMVGAGCGATKSRTATEQLLMSDAVDRAVAQINFRDLEGQKVYFDTKYVINTKDPVFIGNLKGLGFVNAEYVISSLRQQMVAADLRLQDKIEEADYVVEARLGAVGVDNNEVIYGLPANNGLSSAASLVTNAPQLPSIPELSVARKNVQVGAAKIGVFAYDRRTKEPIWQAGISQSSSDARDTWVLGVGPFQRGTIYRGTQFAGSRLSAPALAPTGEQPVEDAVTSQLDPMVFYAEEFHFHRPSPEKPEAEIRQAVHQEPADKPDAAKKEPEKKEPEKKEAPKEEKPSTTRTSEPKLLEIPKDAKSLPKPG